VTNLPFDTLGDFAPVTRLLVVPGALIVQASLPVKSAGARRARPSEALRNQLRLGGHRHRLELRPRSVLPRWVKPTKT